MGKYTLLGRTIEFEECNERFFDIQHRVWNAMDAASSDFNKWYDGCGDILTVLKGYENKAAELIIRNSNEPLFQELPTLGIYDMSEDHYDDECLVINESIDALEVVADAYNSIIAQQEAEVEYRAERKACRGRVVGGGFGLSGSLKGMATAGAMNAVSGAGHSIVNAIGNATSAMEAASAKRALYNNSSVKAVLRNGIRSDILSCFNNHINLINEKRNRYYIGCFDADKAGALFQNAKKVLEKRTELLIESFKNCPWDKELLVYLFTTYKEDRKNVWDISLRFHVDLHETAETVFSNMYTGAARTSEEKAQTVKKDIVEQMHLLGITVSGTIDRIERDGIARILHGYSEASDERRQEMFLAVDNYSATDSNKSAVIHELGIWELAQKYHVSFTSEEAEAILGKVYTSAAKRDEEQAQIAKKKIKTIMQALGVKESTAFNELETDCLSRLCIDYQKANEAQCNEMLDKIKAYGALSKNKKPFINRIQSRIEAIWSAEDGEIFDNVYLNADIEDRQQVEEAITFIKAKKRTASANKYLNALAGCNEQNIKKARQFQQSTTKLAMLVGIGLVILGIIFLFVDLGFILSVAVVAAGAVLLVYYFNLKKAWDLLTLSGSLVHSKISATGQAQRSSIKPLTAEAIKKAVEAARENTKSPKDND